MTVLFCYEWIGSKNVPSHTFMNNMKTDEENVLNAWVLVLCLKSSQFGWLCKHKENFLEFLEKVMYNEPNLTGAEELL